MSTNLNTIRDLAQQDYKWGFVTDIEHEQVPKGLNEDTIRVISAKKQEPEFMLEWRLKAYRHWESLEKAEAEPKWANVKYGPIDYQDIVYYSAPKQKPGLKSLDELDPEILRTYEKLGIPLQEQKMLAGVAVDAVFERFCRDHLQGEAGGYGGDLLFVFRSGAKASRAGSEVSWIRRPLH